ncbi:MAG: filamentous hemagglutinin N-terminal domain-containing protein, partial [Planctomycetota bacterium]
MELRKRGPRRCCFRYIIIYLLIYCMIFNVSLPVVLAGPVNPTVVEGAATFEQSGNTTTITTATNQTIINYDSFDVFSYETANFMQPYSSSNVLNRINSAQPTALDGTILSNGGVYWLNPAGVIIGEGAYINVSKFIAAAHDMSNSDFLNGVDRFAGGYGIV